MASQRTTETPVAIQRVVPASRMKKNIGETEIAPVAMASPA